MKNLLFILICIVGLWSCNSTYNSAQTSENELNLTDQDTVKITSDKVEYEIIIIEPGFNNWLKGRAKPQGYYSQHFLENRNRQFVVEWNNRVLDPSRFDPLLYGMQIDYNSSIDYGYEVNYKLYYYFIYFQMQYKQQLTNFVPRI